MLHIFRKIFKFAGSRKKLLVQSIGINFIGAIFSAFQFWALMIVLQGLLSENKELKIALCAFLVMLISVIGKSWATYGSIIKQTETGYGMVIEKRIHIGDRLRYIPMGFFNKNSLGNITAVVTTSLGDVENTAARSLAIILSGILQSLAFALAILMIDFRIGCIVLGGIIIYLIMTEVAQRQSTKHSVLRQMAQEDLVEATLEYVQGMSIVKSFNLEKLGNQKINETIKDSHDKNVKLTISSVPLDAMKQFIVRGTSVWILYTTVTLYLQNNLDLVTALLFVVAAFMVYSDLESAGNMASMLQMLNDSMNKANEIDSTPIMDQDGRHIPLNSADIEFKNVDFSYGKDKNGNKRKILDNVSFTIPNKTTTAIIGPSGSGKSTLCSLIARFWDVNKGKVLIGGRDIREYTLDSLLKNVSMVFQNVYLFQDTIENNIKFGKPEATHEEVVRIAKAACCHDFISKLPDGYNTVLGEGGGTLSGGEKQRISIARAMLKDANIVILDEATANVDPENEADLQKAIEALTHDKTIIMIAHRLKTVRHADQILVLDKGHIVQSGKHEELIKKPGIYADFINIRKQSIGWKLQK
ncbi:ABC transporter ATP-binding protein [Cellulosilyticum ruminicola]|uniref:ABC transporter ATP-binding protein n=1 Tax=Cellulosilyticum ruminicola TaxID=425254 RepID=UPI0006CFC5A3|nr:ABC transporter ATP-binding protein [Cellulosilyticum ruminicola]